jgi:hypothetical protein
MLIIQASIAFHSHYVSMKVIPSLFTLFFFLLSTAAHAQMFSINSDEEEKESNPLIEGYSTVYLSYNNADFSYQGNSQQPGFQSLGFTGSLLSVGYETTNTLIELSIGASRTGLTNNSEFLSIHFKNLRPILGFGKPTSRFTIPIGLSIDYTRASDTRSTLFGNNLNQSGFMAGSGLQYFLEKRNFIITLGADAFYGFSFADGSAFRGNTMRVNLPVRFMFKNVINQNDITIGYGYHFKRIDVTNDPLERFDYDFSNHQIVIGLRFN